MRKQLFSLSLEFQFTGEMMVFALLVYLMNEDFLGPSGELSSYIVLFVIGAKENSLQKSEKRTLHMHNSDR